MRHLSILIFLFIPFLTFSQDCDCTTNFVWAKSIFEKNDAGFAYALEQKGQQAYDNHNEVFTKKIKAIKEIGECTSTIYEWLTFFRSGHLGIRNLNQGQGGADGTNHDQEIITQFSDWEKLDVNLAEFEKYLAAKEEVDYEGIWISEPYKIGIKKVGESYIGFVIEADGVYWTKGQVKLKIHPDLSTDYYMRDHSTQSFDYADLMGNNYLQMGFVTLFRENQKADNDPKFERYFKAVSTRLPYFEMIDEETSYLRIPTFLGSEKRTIDSVILANRTTILNTPNFIIDIRDNGGGSDRSYHELLPILYTNPIRAVGVELYSTPLNNQRMLDFINEEQYDFDEEEKEWAQESYDKLSNHIGAFVNLDSTDVELTTYDTIFPYPKNIGIIINENNGSTAEQFLLAANQSKKVKLFGTTTIGVLDISNMYFVKSPCEEFELGYSLSRSLRIPDMAIDDKGIQPDFYIDKSIKKYDWIDFVSATLNE